MWNSIKATSAILLRWVVDKSKYVIHLYHMKNVTVRELRNRFGQIAKWIERGETVQIMKRGKPFADLVPKTAGKPKVILGATPSPYPLPEDLDEPVEADWEALK
jgi:antitoxin (DNA-binding transcriptional repressor) of toxin-antitoxin stability system